MLVGVNTLLHGAVMLADTRLSIPGPNGEALVRDACQKMFIANEWSVISMAGRICPARYLLNGLVGRLKDVPNDDTGAWFKDGTLDWLRNDDQLLTFVWEGLTHHAQKPGHVDCPQKPVGLMLGWVDYGAEPDGPSEGPAVELIAIKTPEMAVRRMRGLEAEVLGNGEVIAPVFTQELLVSIANMGNVHQPWARANQAIFVAEVARRALREHHVPSVGGLYQAIHLHPGAVPQRVPYWYWSEVEPGFGTYVAMRFENGQWVQHHRPSGVQITVASPFLNFPDGPTWDVGAYEVFDPGATLNRHSPGVIPAPPFGGPIMQYVTYDAANVPNPIRLSWGDEPLPPLTEYGGEPWEPGG